MHGTKNCRKPAIAQLMRWTTLGGEALELRFSDCESRLKLSKYQYNITIVITRMRFPMFTLKLTHNGNSVGVILPKEVLARLKLEKGGTVFVTETPEGFALTPYDPALEEQLKAGREFMKEYRDTFHQLAK
jgi:putative addiction module antidote